MVNNLIFEIGIVLFSATFLAIIAKAIRQPLIPAYILAGILIGPEFLSIIKNETFIRFLSELGIAFLLFITGLELDLEKIKRLGKNITFISFFQILITFILGYFIAIYLGFSQSISIYMGFLLTFSSTMVVIKLCDEYNQLLTLHGRIILGILLMQDIVAVGILSLLTQGNIFDIYVFVDAFIKAGGFISIAILLSKYVFPYIVKKLSKDRELLFLFSVSVLFVFIILSYFLGLSISIGAFLAGIALASFPYNIEVAGSIKSLRDFFSVVFFASLGMELKLDIFNSYLNQILILSIFVIFLKPVLIYFLTSLFKYERKTSLFSGLYLGQTSEFSLIIASTAAILGKIPQEIFQIIVAITLLTMFTTTYFIRHSFSFFKFIESIMSKKLFQK